jgi:hypothetical protein
MNHLQDLYNRCSIANQPTDYKHKLFLLCTCALLLFLLICPTKSINTAHAQSACLLNCQAILANCVQSGAPACQDAFDDCVDKCLSDNQ